VTGTVVLLNFIISKFQITSNSYFDLAEIRTTALWYYIPGLRPLDHR
jgi:hypothetical protein